MTRVNAIDDSKHQRRVFPMILVFNRDYRVITVLEKNWLSHAGNMKEYGLNGMLMSK